MGIPEGQGDAVTSGARNPSHASMDSMVIQRTVLSMGVAVVYPPTWLLKTTNSDLIVSLLYPNLTTADHGESPPPIKKDDFLIRVCLKGGTSKVSW